MIRGSAFVLPNYLTLSFYILRANIVFGFLHGLFFDSCFPNIFCNPFLQIGVFLLLVRPESATIVGFQTDTFAKRPSIIRQHWCHLHTCCLQIYHTEADSHLYLLNRTQYYLWMLVLSVL